MDVRPGLGGAPVPSLKTLNVFNVRHAADSKARGLDPTHAELQSIEGHDFHSLLAKVVNEPEDTKHPLRNLRLELRISRENDNRLDGVGRQEIKETLYRPKMAAVL